LRYRERVVFQRESVTRIGDFEFHIHLDQIGGPRQKNTVIDVTQEEAQVLQKSYRQAVISRAVLFTTILLAFVAHECHLATS